jgi:hypothetical protein
MRKLATLIWPGPVSFQSAGAFHVMCGSGSDAEGDLLSATSGAASSFGAM